MVQLAVVAVAVVVVAVIVVVFLAYEFGQNHLLKQQCS